MSSDIEKELRRFEDELTTIIERARECVGWLRSVESDDLRFLVAERLPTLGRLALPELMTILEDDQVRGSTRYLAAWVALQLGDRGSSIDVLCEEVDADTEWSGPAAAALARHGIKEGIYPVIEALARVDARDDLSVMGYATALRNLGGSLPSTVRQRLLGSASPWVASALRNDFPA